MRTAFLLAAGAATAAGIAIGVLSVLKRGLGAYGYSPRIEDAIWLMLIAAVFALLARRS